MDTPLQITFRDLEKSDALERTVRERVAKLERFHSKIIAGRVVLELAHGRPNSVKRPLAISIEIEVPGKLLVSKAEEGERASQDDRGRMMTRAFQAMERQLEEADRINRRDTKEHGDALQAGRVLRLFRQQRYGFLEIAGEPNLYFTENACHGVAYDDLEPGMMVLTTRAATEGPMGPQASTVRRIGDEDRMPGA